MFVSVPDRDASFGRVVKGKRSLKLGAMSRHASILAHGKAGHPFRRSLPRHVCRGVKSPSVEAAEDARTKAHWQMSGGDWRRFLSAYCAALVVVTTFIA